MSKAVTQTLCTRCHKYTIIPGRTICSRCVALDVEAGRPPLDEHELHWRMAEWGWPADAPTERVTDDGEAFAARWKGYHVEKVLAYAVQDGGRLLGQPEDWSDRRVGARPTVILRWRAWKEGAPGFLEVWRDPVTHQERRALRDFRRDAATDELVQFAALVRKAKKRGPHKRTKEQLLELVREGKRTAGIAPGEVTIKAIAFAAGYTERHFFALRQGHGISDEELFAL